MTKHIYKIFVVVGILLTNSAWAQVTINANKEQYIRPKLLVNYSLTTHFLFNQPGSQLGIVYKIAPALDINAEYGIIHEKLQFFNLLSARSIYPNDREVRGQRFAGKIRYYMRDYGGHSKEYISFSFEGERSTISREMLLLRNEGEYSQLYPMEIANITNSWLLGLGSTVLSKEKFNLSFEAGLGIRHRQLTGTIPEDAVRIFEGGIFLRDGLSDLTYPFIRLGMYLNFVVID